jgi:hypothetical protein
MNGGVLLFRREDSERTEGLLLATPAAREDILAPVHRCEIMNGRSDFAPVGIRSKSISTTTHIKEKMSCQ